MRISLSFSPLSLFSTAFSLFFVIVSAGFLKQRFKKQGSPYTPFASVIIPLKGKNPDFGGFLDSLQRQTYAHKEYLFCLTDGEDPAIAQIRRLSGVKYRIIITPPDATNSDKIQNVFSGLAHIGKKTEVIVTLDADGSFADHYLSALIEPLQDRRFSCACSYRIFRAETFGGMVIKYWNLAGKAFKEFIFFPWPWSGGMAIRKEDLPLMGIPHAWEGKISEDMVMGELIPKARLKVFDVHTYAVSTASEDILRAIEWIFRQQWYAFVYNKKMHYYNVVSFLMVFLFAYLFVLTQHLLFILPLVSTCVASVIFMARYGTAREWLRLPFIYCGVLLASAVSLLFPPFMKRVRWGIFEYTVDRRGTIIAKRKVQ